MAVTAIKPPRLQKGDKILIISPSEPINSAQRLADIKKGIKTLQKPGFNPILAPNALSNSLVYSASPQEKAEDINNGFKDSSIKALIFSIGGQNANSVLPLLDYSLIKKNPKIILGISNATVLLNGIFAKTGLATFHGNDLIHGFGRNQNEYEIGEFLERLTIGKPGKIN